MGLPTHRGLGKLVISSRIVCSILVLSLLDFSGSGVGYEGDHTGRSTFAGLGRSLYCLHLFPFQVPRVEDRSAS